MQEREFFGWFAIIVAIIVLWFAFRASETPEDREKRARPMTVKLQEAAARVDKGIKKNKRKRKKEGRDKGRFDTTPEFLDKYGGMVSSDGAAKIAKIAGSFGPTLISKFGGAFGFLSGIG
jgi:hypothetical protein